MIKIAVSGSCAKLAEAPRHITAGTVGLPVVFAFDESWQGLHKTAVFKAGDTTIDVSGIDTLTEVPWEVLRTPGEYLHIGVYGTNEDGTKVTPTVWVQIGKIAPSARPCGRPSSNPPSPTWEALAAQIAALDTQIREGVAFPVTVVQTDDGSYTADKSVADISAALADKKICYAEVQPLGVRLSLTSVHGSIAVFDGLYTTEDGTSVLSVLLEDVADAGTAVDAYTIPLANADDIPRKISDLPNDAGYVRAPGYASLADAIRHINDGTVGDGTVEDGACLVFTSTNGALTAMLTRDVVEDRTLEISQSMDISLGGHALTFTAPAAYINILPGAAVTIHAEGGTISKTYDAAQSSAYNLIKTAGALTIHRGQLRHRGNNAVGVLVVNATAGAQLHLDGCEISGINTSTATNSLVRTVQIKARTELHNCRVTAQGAGTVHAVIDTGGADLTLDSCQITADSSGDIATAVDIKGTAHLTNCTVAADAPNDSEGYPYGVGVENTGTAYLNNCDIDGTMAGVTNLNALYGSGGRWRGYSHGGAYLAHGSGGAAYLKDVEMLCGEYVGRYDPAAFAAGALASLYVGEADQSYFDGCSFGDMGDALLVLRGTGGETENAASLSNCTIPDGTAKLIRIDAAGGHSLNLGIGGNITGGNTNNPAAVTYTGLLYRRFDGAEVCKGADFNALLTAQKPLVGSTVNVTPTQAYNALLTGRGISLSHRGYANDIDYGNMVFGSFVWSEQVGIVSSTVFSVGGMTMCAQIIGNTSEDYWMFNAIVLGQ